MYQKRAPFMNGTTGKDAEVDATNDFTSPAGSTGGKTDRAAGQPKLRPSEKYIPVYHIELVHERQIKIEPRPAIHNSDDVVAILRDEFSTADREKLICLMLNSKNVVIGMNLVSVGSLTASISHPREILKPAILCNSAAIILSHNHPSNDPSPSQDDIRLTERVNKACEILGIKLLDHVIIGDPDSYSFRNAGRLP